MPAVLLLVGIVGLVISDAATQAQIVTTVAAALPPLADLIETLVREVARNAASFSVVGALTLLWGTSRFVVGFERALARVIHGKGRRSMVIREAGAFAAVLLIIAAVIGGTLLSGFVASLHSNATLVLPLLTSVLDVVVTLLPLVVTAVGMIVIYHIVPLPHPQWRAAGPPGAVVGIVLVVLATVFVYLAPRLIGAAAFLGTVATIFAALAWLSLSFQAILIGAAWVGDRSDQLSPEVPPET